MAVRVAVAIVAALLLAAPVASSAQDAARMAMARVRLTTDPRLPVGCTTLGTIDDTSVKDLRRKVVRLGGDTALLSFPANDLERMNAVVFRCPASTAPAAARPPGATASPPPPNGAPTPHVPPPPPSGAPPPPPPTGSAPATK